MNVLPTLPEAADAPATLLSWFVFDDAMQAWVDVRLEPLPPSANSASGAGHPATTIASELTLVTWNVDAFSPQSEDRLAGILDAVRGSGGGGSAFSAAVATPTHPDILFLQEVSPSGLAYLLQDPWVRCHWYVSDTGAAQPSDPNGFSIVSLVSRRFLPEHWSSSSSSSRTAGIPVLGALWRIDFPSLFGRYAICCEIRMPDPTAAVVRLVNVHLDSLQIRPSRRPRQLQIVADMLHCQQPRSTSAVATATSAMAAHGLVAGDFNPVLPEEDNLLVAANGLVDAWQHLHPDESGVTWGIDGQQPYPPARLDKVAVVGLEPCAMTVLHPGTVRLRGGNSSALDKTATAQAAAGSDNSSNEHRFLPWSDHSGLQCTFRVAAPRRSFYQD
ncbi:hypothetical protein CMQ_905 [Grosmannia clavigera kw1407]|uniref:Endonuclease/exonuclease/phosphatase domain-containing protein n=1 Tax=Grosmannia clavigera (strain kw1407 / UAMH 11150) TaxID=655863 RepID=F0XDD0_GROCL|nr:uncharacterized protein CMQ_905 [Grosmannia clavigera kw1407]EFX03977.1 hypothetical protein CMQ_905 [Grosmannia clavigera kw1407]